MHDADLREVADIVEAINADRALWERAALDEGAELARRIDEEIMRVFGEETLSCVPSRETAE